jgi:LacI family transcriptional regulator
MRLGNMSPTIKDVARLSGVSMSTVSRVMNAPDSVRADKREKVIKAIRELKYYPNALARGLIYKRTQTIGVLIPDVSNPYVSEVIRGMEDSANKLGSNLILCNTDRNQERTINYLKILKEKQVDGIIFTSDPFKKDFYQMFDEFNMPVVLASTQSLEYDIPSVKINDEKAGYDGGMYLLSKGHRKIGMISGPLDDPIAGVTRYSGFKRAMSETNNSETIDEWIEFGLYRYEDGFEAMKVLYYKQPDITAVFVASDEMALGAISYLHQIGVNVPDDVSILGFDNTKISKMCIPKLTTIAQPMYDIGQNAILKLEAIITKQSFEELRSYLDHSIIERDSVKELRR